MFEVGSMVNLGAPLTGARHPCSTNQSLERIGQALEDFLSATGNQVWRTSDIGGATAQPYRWALERTCHDRDE
jgi:hypothetical protein